MNELYFDLGNRWPVGNLVICANDLNWSANGLNPQRGEICTIAGYRVYKHRGQRCWYYVFAEYPKHNGFERSYLSDHFLSEKAIDFQVDTVNHLLQFWDKLA